MLAHTSDACQTITGARRLRSQAEFNALRDQLVQQFHGRAALIFTYDEPLSHLIYAGCDMFLVSGGMRA